MKYSDCVREDGDCPNCSLSSYGRDCHNNKINRVFMQRRVQGMTRKGLAEKSGIPEKNIYNIETGAAKLENITLKNALALADALGVDIARLLDD